MRFKELFVLSVCMLSGIATSASAGVEGKWKRPNGTIAQVYDCGGKLCGKIVSGDPLGFEMFHGMSKTGPAMWQGSGMKHPSMPAFMTFNGTVTMTGNTLNVKGCAIGQSMCDAEAWTRIR